MTTDDLEKLLEAGVETPQVDFKESCPWNPKIFVKDILAMANTQDGGKIVIGVIEKKTGVFERQGTKEADRVTYKLDIMRDQLTASLTHTWIFLCISHKT